MRERGRGKKEQIEHNTRRGVELSESVGREYNFQREREREGEREREQMCVNTVT